MSTPEEQFGTPEETDNFTKLRDHAKDLEKQAKEREKELEELRSFKAQQEAELRASTARSAFTEAGLDQSHADLFLKVNPEAQITPEAVASFAETYRLIPPKTEQERPPGISPPSDGPPPATDRKMSYDEYRALSRHNPQAALEALQNNRVAFSTEVSGEYVEWRGKPIVPAPS